MSKIIKLDPTKVVLNVVNNPSRVEDVMDRVGDVQKLALSFREHGQTSPISVRAEGADGTYIPITGSTRVAAGILLQTGFDYKDGNGVVISIPADPTFKIEAVVVEGIDEKTADLRNLIDNLTRTDLTDLDLANGAKHLADAYGLTNVEITEKLGISNPNKVGECRKLLGLSQEIQTAIHRGTISRDAALEAIKPKGKDAASKAAVTAAKAKLQDAAEKGQTVTATQIKAVAEKAATGAGAPVEKRGKTEVRGGNEIRADLLRWLNDVGAVADDKKAAFAGFDGYAKVIESFVKYTNGKLSFETFIDRFDEFAGVPKKTFG